MVFYHGFHSTKSVRFHCPLFLQSYRQLLFLCRVEESSMWCGGVKITLFVRTYGCPPLTKMKTHCLSKKINVNSSQIFIIYVNIISLLHYEWLYHQIHLIYTLIGVCPTLTKILFKTSLSWKRKCILDIIHHLVTHTPHGQLTSTS